MSGYRPPSKFLQLRYATDIRNLSAKQVFNRVSKCGLHFHASIPARGRTRTNELIMSAALLLEGFPMVSWTAFYTSDRSDIHFTHDQMHLAFFFEHDLNGFLLAYQACEEMDALLDR